MNKDKKKLVKKHNFRSKIIFSDKFSVARMARPKTNLNKPIYIGLAALELSKQLMGELMYEQWT